MIARVALAVVSVLAAGWLGLSLRNDLVAGRAVQEVIGSASAAPAEVRRLKVRAIDEFRSAGTLNPDRTLEIYEALARSAAGDRPGSLRRLSELSASYPEDPLVWQAIIQVAGNSDPRADEARKRLRALKPL